MMGGGSSGGAMECQVFNGPLIFRFVRPLFWDLRGAVIPVGFA